jgi:hypothetical protein
MNVLPSSQQKRQVLADDPHGAADLPTRHVFGPHEARPAVRADQVDLGFSIPEYVDVRRQMVVEEDDDAKTIGTCHGDHAPN